MIRKISMFLLVFIFTLSGSAMVFAKTISNPFLALEYEVGDDWQVYGTYVDTGYAYFEYTDSEWNETITVSANNLEGSEDVTEEEIAALKAGDAREEMIAKWFDIDVSQIERAVVNGKDVFICSLFLNDMDRMYYVYYEGACEYQFSMPAKYLSEATALTKFFESTNFLGHENMLEIDYNPEILHLEEMGGYINVPKYFTYFWSTMDRDHHNFYRANEEYNSLMKWFKEDETYFYMISDRLYDELHFYSSSTFQWLDFSKDSDDKIMNALNTIKGDLEADGHTVEIIGDGIHETEFTKFIALQIRDISGYDSKFYYTTLNGEAYAFEYYYYEGEQDEEFMDFLIPIVDSFTMEKSSGGILGNISMPDALKITTEGTKETMTIFAIVGGGILLAIVIGFMVVAKKSKRRAENDWYGSSGGVQFDDSPQNPNDWGNNQQPQQQEYTNSLDGVSTPGQYDDFTEMENRKDKDTF